MSGSKCMTLVVSKRLSTTTANPDILEEVWHFRTELE